MEINGVFVRLDANDEEPNCMRCSNVCNQLNESVCTKECGPEHGWNRYYRKIDLRELVKRMQEKEENRF